MTSLATVHTVRTVRFAVQWSCHCTRLCTSAKPLMPHAFCASSYSVYSVYIGYRLKESRREPGPKTGRAASPDRFISDSQQPLYIAQRLARGFTNRNKKRCRRGLTKCVRHRYAGLTRVAMLDENRATYLAVCASTKVRR